MRSMIIIHTKDNIFNVVRLNCYIHERNRKIHYKRKNYKKYKTPINKHHSQTRKNSVSCSLVFNPWNKLYSINLVFFLTLSHILTNLRAHSGYIFLFFIIPKVITYSIFIELHYLITKKFLLPKISYLLSIYP